MDDLDTVIENLRSRIGKEEYTDTYEIEKGLIRKFSQAIGDPNPLWLDEEYAKKEGYENIIAPPTLILALGWDEHEQQFKPYMPYNSGVHGSTEVEFYEPVKPNDVITVKCKLADVKGKKGKRFGDMVFLLFERVYTNQKQQLVAICRQTQVSFPSSKEVKNG